MEHQFRQGIYRPNAQRLSISLGPMVAQRSLMFRVRTDLATKTSYAELTPTDESPALYSLPGSAVLPAISAVVSTAMSSASVYSQDSWKTASPSVSVVEVDLRRMTVATATSPSVQWSDIAEKDRDIGFTLKSPSVASISTPPQDAPFSMAKEDNDTVPQFKSDVVPSLANNAVREWRRSLVDVGSLRPLGKRFTKIESWSKKMDRRSPKHSRSSKAFRKVMDRLSFNPSKRELAQLRRTDATGISDNSPLLDFHPCPRSS